MNYVKPFVSCQILVQHGFVLLLHFFFRRMLRGDIYLLLLIHDTMVKGPAMKTHTERYLNYLSFYVSFVYIKFCSSSEKITESMLVSVLWH